MRLSFTLIESTLVGTVHSSGGVQRHRMAYRPQEAIALTREILGTLQEGVRLGAKASAAEPALKLLGSRLARTIMSEQLLLLLAGAEGELVLELEAELFALPWELFVASDNFLCMQFDLARVLVKETGLVKKSTPSTPPRGLVIVSDPDGDLPGAITEGEAVLDVMEQHLGFVARLVFNPGLEEVKRLLGNNDFIHYVGHSVKGAQLEVAWKLRDGLLTGADIRALSQAGPLPYFVFASACPGLSGLEVPWDGQMYAAFLHGGTRHYLGTHWDLPDGQGAEFAVDYYHLMGSASLGAALRGARKGSVKKGDSLVFSLFFHCGEPDYSLSPASVAEEPTRLGVRGDVPWKKPRKNSESLPHGITPVRGGSKRGGRALRFLGAFLIILSVAIPSVYLTHKALKRRRDRIEVVLGRPLMDSTDRTLAFRGFSSTQKGLEGPIIRMERCFIKHLTYVSGLDVIDGREGMLPKGVYLELSGKIIPDKDGPRILLVVHRKRDRTILYIDEFSLFTAGEEQCIKLSEWVKRTLDL